MEPKHAWERVIPISCHISRDTSLLLALDCYKKLSPVKRGVWDIGSLLFRQPTTSASCALLMAGQGGWCTLIVLARTSWNFFPQFSYIFWPSLMIQHKVYMMFCLLVFLSLTLKWKVLQKNEDSKYFTLIFMRCWCYFPVSLVQLGIVSLWTLISATADSHRQKPKSLQMIPHTRQAYTRLCSSWKPSACCCFHSHKIEAVLSEQHGLGFDWTQTEKEREETGLGKAQVCQMPAITCLCPSFRHLWTSSDEWLQWLELLIDSSDELIPF